jgi:hypothetical protein
MRLQKKLLVVALACAFPLGSALAQSVADLKQEIEALKAQLQLLQKKVEDMGQAADITPLSQQVNRIEQKMDLAENTAEASGFQGMKINGVIETTLSYNNIDRSNSAIASSGYSSTNDYAGYGMVQITKESQDGEGVDWTLRLLPGATSMVHEASVSVPLTKERRLIAGFMPDFQGYEYSFPHADSTLGNQLITHNALFDLAGATAYTGVGMSYSLDGGNAAFKWLIGNVDGGYDSAADNVDPINAANSSVKTVALAYRADWYVGDTSYVALSGLHGSMNRNFTIMALDAGLSRGDYQFNGQITAGQEARAAANGGTANWTGVSGFFGVKVLPRLQLMARGDYIWNSNNGGGTYAYNGGDSYSTVGLGPKRTDSTGSYDTDADTTYATTGANLTRMTFGTNYQINSNTQWKTEYRLDLSDGYNFLDYDGTTYRKDKTTISTALMLSF